MTLFLATLLVTVACCLAMAVGVLLHGRPLANGCEGAGRKQGHCAGCPHRRPGEGVPESEQGDHR
jgi:hypothetical protein